MSHALNSLIRLFRLLFNAIFAVINMALEQLKIAILLLWDEIIILLFHFDEWVNFAFGPILKRMMHAEFGNEGETLSYVFGKYSHQCVWCYRICRVLHFLDKNHCENTVINEERERKP